MLALDPKETFEVRLQTDARAVFVCRFLTVREWRALGALVDKHAIEGVPGHELVGRVIEELGTVLVDWRDVLTMDGKPVPFAPETLEDILTIQETWELFYGVLRQQRPSVAEKNGSGSPSPIGSAASAPGNVQGQAAPQAAATALQSEPPHSSSAPAATGPGAPNAAGKATGN